MIATTRKSNVNAVLRLRLLGAYELALNGVPIEAPRTIKARSLLAYFALRRAEAVRREALMTEFWPDAEPQSARNNLKTTLSTIRRTLRDAGIDADAALVITRDFVRWEAATIVDSRDFERCSLDVDDERRFAIEVYGGEFMPGDDNEWAQDVRRNLAIRFEQMLRRELTVAPAPAIAERLLALDPFSDEAYSSLIENALRVGDRRTAQAIYRRYAAALREIDVEPPHDLIVRIGIREFERAPETLPRFFGRTDELVELGRLLNTGTRAIMLSGVPGIGKTSLAQEASRRFKNGEIAISDVTPDDLAENCRSLRQRLQQATCAILCATPQSAQTIREHLPDIAEVEVGPLAYEEIAVTIRRYVRESDAALVDAVWKRSNGYPLVLHALAELLEDTTVSADTIARSRLPRDLERRFESSLRAAGNDAIELGLLLALEPRLDNDDLVVLLGWNLSRVIDAHESLFTFGAAYPFYAEAALRTISPIRREHLIDRIAERLKLHEDPSAKMRSAELLKERGRRGDAGRAYLEAGASFVAAAAWENAGAAIDTGIDTLEPVATSEETLDVLRELYRLKGHVLYQQGSFVASLHALESVIQLSEKGTHARIRTSTLLSMGHALVRADMLQPATAVAKQAVEESAYTGDARSELGAQHLLARVLRDQLKYDDSVRIATLGYEHAMDAREWPIASSFANLIIEVSRRLLKFEACFHWTERQLEAEVLAGPLLEAEARHMTGSVKATVHRFEEALAEFAQALALVEQHRRRQTTSATPVRQLEWQIYHALAHTHVAANDIDRALVESEWLLRSPWMFNSPFSSWQATSVSVDARLASGTHRDLKAAQMIVQRLPRAFSDDPRLCIDILARARIAARSGWDQAPGLLREAFESLSAAAAVHEDQIHPYFYRLADSAKGVDDIVAMKALDAARTHERHVIERAGPLWGLSA